MKENTYSLEFESSPLSKIPTIFPTKVDNFTSFESTFVLPLKKKLVSISQVVSLIFKNEPYIFGAWVICVLDSCEKGKQ